MIDPGLLQPSLRQRPPEAGFSQRASFFVAFFGGGIAALLFTAWNAVLWRRWQKDLPLLVAAGALVLAATWGLTGAVTEVKLAGEEPSWWLSRGAPRALGIAMWALFAMRHRAMFKAVELSDLKPRSPWGPALAVVLVAFGISMLVTAAVRGGVG